MVNPEFEVYIKTIFGEARGQIELGQKWVAWVIKNRAFYWNKTISEVCLDIMMKEYTNSNAGNTGTVMSMLKFPRMNCKMHFWTSENWPGISIKLLSQMI